MLNRAAHMIRGAVELSSSAVQDGHGPSSSLRCAVAPAVGPAGVLRVTRKHEVVDHQGVLPARIAPTTSLWRSRRSLRLEDVVLSTSPPAGRCPLASATDSIARRGRFRYRGGVLALLCSWATRLESSMLISTHPSWSDPSLRLWVSLFQ